MLALRVLLVLQVLLFTLVHLFLQAPLGINLIQRRQYVKCGGWWVGGVKLNNSDYYRIQIVQILTSVSFHLYNIKTDKIPRISDSRKNK